MQYQLNILKDKLDKFKNEFLNLFYKLRILEDTSEANSRNIKRLIRENDKKIKKIFFITNILFFLIPYTFFSYGVYRNRYLTSSKIVIRNSSNNNYGNNSILSFIDSNTSASFNEARFIKTFLHSPKVFKEVEEKFSFSKFYSKKGLDFISGISPNSPFSKKLEFYKNNVILKLDSISGELEIKVISLQPKTAYLLNKFLIKKSEEFINDLNANISRSQLEFQTQEVLEAFKKLKNKEKKLTEFQNKNLLFDGYDAIRANTNIINGLENELVNLKFKLSTIKRKFVDQKAPEIISLESQIIELKKQIQEERNLIYSDSGKRLNKKALYLKNLKTDLEFQTDLYKSALTIQESARIGTIKQNRYIIKLIEPYLAERQYLYAKNKFFFSSVIIIILTFYLIKFIFGIVDNYQNN